MQNRVHVCREGVGYRQECSYNDLICAKMMVVNRGIMILCVGILWVVDGGMAEDSNCI